MVSQSEPQSIPAGPPRRQRVFDILRSTIMVHHLQMKQGFGWLFQLHPLEGVIMPRPGENRQPFRKGPFILKRLRKPIFKRYLDWLDDNPNRRDRLLGFAFSCCVHLGLVVSLSLIAIGTGTLDTKPSLLDGTSVVTEDEQLTLIPAAELEVELDLPETPTEYDSATNQLPALSDLAVVSGSPQSTDAPVPEETTDVSTVQGGSEPSSRTSPLDGAPALASATIQKRVTKAGGRKGEVQFALVWRNINDVDLHVIAPSGEHISHMHRRSQCAGMLDVDMNVEGESEEPVENVRWITNAPWGRYTVLINFYKLNSDGVRRPRRQSPYQLLAQLGSESLLREATAGFGELQVTVWRFHYIPDSYSSLEREQLLKQLEALQAKEEATAAPMLEQAKAANGPFRQRILQTIVQSYPHTDAAIEAMQLMEGEVVKRSSNR